MFILKKLRLISSLIIISVLTACASTSTKEIQVSEFESQQEQREFAQFAAKYKKKDPKTLAVKTMSMQAYQHKADHVVARLMVGARKIYGQVGYAVHVKDSKELNAFADGRKIIVTTSMINFVDTDDELALVLAHEIAHNVHGHVSKSRQNAGLGAILDILAIAGGVDTQGTFTQLGHLSHSQKFEIEADYVGLYILAHSGYNIDSAPLLWRKMAVQYPQSERGGFFATHPASTDRHVMLKKSVQEIKTKLAKGEALVPDTKA